MGGVDRRAALQLIAATPFALSFHLSPRCLVAAHEHAAEAGVKTGTDYQPRFFTQHEWDTLRLLVDCIIPADERSGSATDARVPEFIDFIMTDPEEEERTLEARQTAMRGGLAWIDAECHQRFGQPLIGCSEANQKELLDVIAFWRGEDDEPEQIPIDLRIVTPGHGRAFFNSLRDLTASGFWSSEMGVEDLQYMGNAVFEWTGPPAAVLRKLGVDPSGIGEE
jgi:gluconate 2-dehydrogenase gamma chain